MLFFEVPLSNNTGNKRYFVCNRQIASSELTNIEAHDSASNTEQAMFSNVTICSALNLFFGMTQAPFQAILSQRLV
jgi:hypothetical protein